MQRLADHGANALRRNLSLSALYIPGPALMFICYK